MSENLKFWNSVEKTDKSWTKKVSIGNYVYTAIDAYQRIRLATENWGMFGKDWGVQKETFEVVIGKLLIYQAEMYYPNGVIPIASSIAVEPLAKGDPKLDDDCVKKVRTDALTKGLSMLGFNADVYLGQFDDNKYVDKQRTESAVEFTDCEEVRERIRTAFKLLEYDEKQKLAVTTQFCDVPDIDLCDIKDKLVAMRIHLLRLHKDKEKK